MTLSETIKEWILSLLIMKIDWINSGKVEIERKI